MKIEMPNLPNGRVTLVAVGECYGEIISSLESLGIKVITVPKSDALPPCENCHADLRIHHLGGDKIVAYKEDTELINKLRSCGFSVVSAQNGFSGKYPKSVALNALRIGNILLCKKSSLDPEILKFASENSLEIVDCNQGYSKCATCVISESAAITSDPSVYRALKDKIDVLKIGVGNIRLYENNDGMIGGATFMLDSETLAFCGDATKHPDYIEIENFLKKHDISPFFLTKHPLSDVGSVIPLETAKKV